MYNLYERMMPMKKIMTQLHKGSKHTLISGIAVIAIILVASTVLHMGAGRMFDYYSATDISEKVLASVRPISVAICVGSLGIEYISKNRKND